MKRTLFAALFLTAACGQPAAPPPDAPKADVVAPDVPASPTPQARSPEDIAAKIAALPAPYNAGVYENGRRMFLQCRSCHTVELGGVNRVGPALHGVFGRPAGVAAGFSGYSAALKGSGLVWDEATIDRWVENPRALVPGNNMVYPGLRKAEDRRDLVAYLGVETSD
jgi:cytochrome c